MRLPKWHLKLNFCVYVIDTSLSKAAIVSKADKVSKTDKVSRQK